MCSNAIISEAEHEREKFHANTERTSREGLHASLSARPWALWQIIGSSFCKLRINLMATSAHQASRAEHRRERSSRELIAGCTKPPATFSRAPVTSGSGSCSTAALVARLTLRKQLKSSAKSTGMKLPALQHESPRVGLQSVSLQLSLEENPAEATVRARHFLLNPVNASDSPTSQHTSPSNYASIHPSTRPAMLVRAKNAGTFFGQGSF